MNKKGLPNSAEDKMRRRLQNPSADVIAKRLLAAEQERLSKLSPHDIKIRRKRNSRGMILSDSSLTSSQRRYRKNRQYEIYRQIVKNQQPGPKD